MGANSQNVHLFEADLGAFAALLDLDPRIVLQRVVLDAHARITKRTPVDTGRARASWDVKQGSPSTFVPAERKKSVAGDSNTKLGNSSLTGVNLGEGAKKGGRAKSIGGAVADIDGTKVVFITSSLDYMQYLEEGSSKQAPVGMVAITLAEIEVEIDSIVGQLS